MIAHTERVHPTQSKVQFKTQWDVQQASTDLSIDSRDKASMNLSRLSNKFFVQSKKYFENS